MVDKIKAGAAFADVAAGEKLKLEWRPGIKRGASIPGLPAAAIAAIFRTAQDGVGSVDAGPSERIVFRVTEIKVPTLDLQSAEAKRIDDVLKNSITEDLVAQYVAQLEKDVGVSINQSALNQVTGGGGLN
jgi:peptidyl-prolyl cis-trans isomerase D